MMLSSQSRLLLSDMKRLFLNAPFESYIVTSPDPQGPHNHFELTYSASAVSKTKDETSPEFNMLLKTPSRLVSEDEAGEVCKLFHSWRFYPWKCGLN